MAQINFQELFNSLKDGVVGLATTTAKDYAAQAKEDGLNVLNEMKDRLQIWAIQLKDGLISVEEFEFQIGTEQALLKMVALKQAGIAKIEIDKFKNGLVDLIVKTLSSVL